MKEQPAATEDLPLKCSVCGHEWLYNVKTMPQVAYKKDCYMYYFCCGKPVYCDKCNEGKVVQAYR